MTSRLGNINTCLHPQRIFNRYTEEWMYVPCRKCVTCRSSYASNWSNRVENECKEHRYSLFVTLTYDNDHLPVYSPLFDSFGRQKPVWFSNRLSDSGNFVDDKLCSSVRVPQKMDDLCFGYCCKKDVQDFLKRLRSRIDYMFNRVPFSCNLSTHKINYVNRKSSDYHIRYFVASEYGPKTLRPHYHAIFWYDSEELQGVINELICESWSNGNTDISLVNSSASSYVAKYVNGDTRLPAYLRTQFTSTFHLASKHPYIGFSKVEAESLRENVFNGTYGYNKLNESTSQIEFVPTSRNIENRLLPKCRGYRTLSRSERVRVYSLAYDYKQRGLDYRVLLPFEFDYSAYPHLDIHCSLVCLDWCERYGLTPELFVDMLDHYYYLKSMYQLKTQYTYQETYVDGLGMPLYHLVDFDLDLFTKLPRCLDAFLISPWRSVMETYGLTSDVLYIGGVLNVELIDKIGQRSSSFYADNVLLYNKIVSDSLKNKKLNEELNPQLFT